MLLLCLFVKEVLLLLHFCVLVEVPCIACRVPPTRYCQGLSFYTQRAVLDHCCCCCCVPRSHLCMRFTSMSSCASMQVKTFLYRCLLNFCFVGALAVATAWCAGDGGAHKHYGPTYIGLQPPPVALCLNLFNIDYRQPQNKWAQNPTACQRLYDETLAIINSKAPNKISAVEAIAKQMT